MYNVLLFAGTTEGRKIAEFLCRNEIKTYICVTTEYGEELLPKGNSICVSHHKMGRTEMISLIREINPELVIDGTHPYAAEATGNIIRACRETGKDYLRVLRETGSEGNNENYVYVRDVEEAVNFLKKTEGNILVTTGSKEIEKYTEIPDYRERVFARVLSLPKVAETCSGYGFCGKNLICMQGPFSEEMNRAMLKQFNCKYMVTKISGKAGGYGEKIKAAADTGVIPIIVGKPFQEEGISVDGCISFLRKRYEIKQKAEISLVGIGAGNRKSLTAEAEEKIKEADLLIGAKRMTESVKKADQDIFNEYNSAKIKAYIDGHPGYRHIAVLLSGDTGFYSGARKLIDILSGYHVEVIPGISSLVYFMAKIKKSWDDVYITSVHGRQSNLIDQIRTRKKVFSILGSGTYAGELAEELTDLRMGDIRFYIGENLSYENEKIITGTAAALSGYQGEALSVLYLENPDAEETPATHGIKDDAFIRAKVPMTKEEVRTVSLGKLHLYRNSVCYDIGAGTGSVSIEMALRATDGRVFAIEKKPEAVELIRANREKFRLGNLEIIEGEAPEALKNLERPTHAFIGGSSGNMRKIIYELLEMNPEIRVIINCIAMETVAETISLLKEFSLKDIEVIQLSVSRAKELGRYHLMIGENPITIISFTGGSE